MHYIMHCNQSLVHAIHVLNFDCKFRFDFFVMYVVRSQGWVAAYQFQIENAFGGFLEQGDKSGSQEAKALLKPWVGVSRRVHHDATFSQPLVDETCHFTTTTEI